MFDVKDDYECFIKYKTRAAAELQKRSILYPSCYFIYTKEFSIQMLYKPRKTRQKFCENQRVFYHV